MQQEIRFCTTSDSVRIAYATMGEGPPLVFVPNWFSPFKFMAHEPRVASAVQLAARICAYAQPGQILAANVVRELAAGKVFLFSDKGDVTLRGFDDPVRLFEVGWREEG